MRAPSRHGVSIPRRSSADSSSSRTSLLRVFIFLFLSASLCCHFARAHPANGEKAADAQIGPTASSDSDEPHACAKCHSELVKSFAGNPHAGHAKTAVSCASCHGSGAAYVQSNGARSAIFDPAEATARQVDDMCLGCHAGAHAASEHPVHGNVSCIGCHSIHAAGAPVHMLKVVETELCYQCHSEIKPKFSMSFHHKVGEGLIICTDCHDPHDTSKRKLLRSPSQQQTVCTTCHTEAAGPFVYEHPAIKAEGCTACHVAHGGSNPHLLNRASVDTICQQCHLPPPKPMTGVPDVHNPATQTKFCTDCHTDIHGSNVSPVFATER